MNPQADIGFYITADVHARFTKMQHETFARFVVEPWQAYLCDNASDNDAVSQQIRNSCDGQSGLDHAGLKGFEYVKLPLLDRRSPNRKHGSALQWMWDNLVMKHTHPYIIMCDFDAFLVREFSVRKAMLDYSVWGGAQSGRDSAGKIRGYLWPGLTMFRREKCPKLDTIQWAPCQVDGAMLDVGGAMCHWLEMWYCHVPIRYYGGSGILCKGKNDWHLPASVRAAYDDKYAMHFIDNRWLHARNGANWADFPQDLELRKTAYVESVLRAAMNGESIGEENEPK